MVEGKAEVESIDDADRGPETVEMPVPVPDVPDHLVRQPCGLPKVLMLKDELIKYEMDHGITVEERKVMEITAKERDLYELYTTAKGRQATQRVTKQHFVAALRLFTNGFEIWPNRAKDLNDMKVV